jgi:hypothetical protein
MSMNDPRSSPPRGPYVGERTNAAPWIFGAVAALVVLGLIGWSMSDRTSTTATNPPSQTTGQGGSPATPPNPKR